MVSYGSNAEVQRLAFGAADSNQDTRSTSARDVATSIINAELNLTADLSTVPDVITRACNLIAAGIILTGQTQVDSGVKHPFWLEGLKLLENIGDQTDDTTGGPKSIVVERF